MNFPHLKDTEFPNIGTVDVYKFANTFDYTRWNENTVVKCVNVLWNSDYKDVVKFDTDNARDKWFDNIEDYYATELSQVARIVPDNYVKLPIPYDVMARYNYMYIDMPIATSANAPIDYETGYGIRRWYFFIDSVSYLSPNSTQVFLTLDVWTNFQNAVDITYMMLERGHAPVAKSDTAEYLENPISNNKYLLAPDVNFDNASITRSGTFVPFGNGEKYVCIASTCSPDLIPTLGAVTEDGNYEPFSGTLSYSDIDARYGHQLQVNGLTLGNGRNYSQARTPAKVGYSNDGLLPNNLSVYAIRASECYGNGTFFTDVVQKCPQFLNTVKACFVVDENCVTLGQQYFIAGHSVYRCVGTKRNLLTKQLTENDFNYPTEYRRFAKLYTSPYAVLEVTDNDGTTFTVNIEETSTIQVKSVVSVAFPYIDYRVYLDGIGGVGSSSYSWVDLRGQSNQQEMSNSDWFKYCFDWEIPTFALYMDGETAYQLANFNRATKMGVNNALVAYHNSMRSANTAMENAEDEADTALSNVQNSTTTARQNAYNSADTGKTNADNSADTSKTNADASADTAYTNLDNALNTQEANRVISLGYRLSNVLAANTTALQIMQDSQEVSVQKDYLDESLAFATVATEGIASTTMLTNTSIASVGKGIVHGAFLAGGTEGGTVAAAGGIIGGATSGLDAITNMQNNAVSINMSYEQADNIANHNHALTNDINNPFAERTQYSQNNLAVEQLQNNAGSEKEQMENSHAMQRRNGANTRDTTKANATRSQATAKTNASNTRSTSRTNADNNYNTDRLNASNTRYTTVNNAGFTRQVMELNAKELLENAANAAMASTLDAKNAAPITIGSTSGNPTTDYMQNRGIQLKVKTQSDSAIRQTGDTFARYGYALNQVWDVRKTGLCLMKNFTYWKAADIWVDDRESSNNSIQDFFTNIFLSGVTVWNNPTKMGKVSIYDN